MIPYNRAVRKKIKDKLAVPGVRCYLCSKTIDIHLPKGLPGSFELEDIVPRALGGNPNDIDNLLPSHRSCNGAKGVLPVDDAIRTAKAKRRNNSREW